MGTTTELHKACRLLRMSDVFFVGYTSRATEEFGHAPVRRRHNGNFRR